MTVERLLDDVWAAETIARDTFVFVAEAARRSKRTYTHGEAADVVIRFQAAMLQYSQVTGMQPITVLDLT